MRVLIVKTSSMGDVIHTLPALTDALHARPELVFDWVVEEGFAEIPAWHPGVARVIPVALRRWRRQPLAAIRSGEWTAFRHQLAAEPYAAVIDAQGLIKSALLSRLVPAPRYGYAADSAREPLASRAYTQRFSVSWQQHAIERIRELFSRALDYPRPQQAPDYGLPRAALAGTPAAVPYAVFLHGTARAEKCWPEPFWVALAQQTLAAGMAVHLPWGNAAEQARAERIAAASGAAAVVLPRLNLRGMAAELAAARAVVAVDTGLGHLAAALGVPGISLYGPTDPERIGAVGAGQIHLCAGDQVPAAVPGLHEPFAALTPDRVWAVLEGLLQPADGVLPA